MKTRLIILLMAAAGVLAAQAGLAVKLPAYSRKALPNGAVLILIDKPDVPLVTVRALFRGGAEAEPANLAGVTALTVELMRRGAGGRDAAAFNEQMDALGATLISGANRQFSYAAVEFLARYEKEALALFADMLARPSFEEGEVKKALSQAADASRAAKDNPQAAISNYFPSYFYGAAHPYGRPSTGDEVTIANLNRDQIAAWHKRMFGARNLILIAAGDIRSGTLAWALEKLAGSLAPGMAYSWKQNVPPAAFDSARLLLIDKPDATQTYFFIAAPGIHRTHPDRVPLEIVNTLFGGRFTSMLNDELRVNSGLTYGARSMVEQNRLPGAVLISTYTQTGTTVKAMDLALEVLNRLNTSGIDAEMLQSAKNYIKGNFPTSQLETADQVAGLAGELEIFGLDRDEIDEYFRRIDAVTVEKANEAARRWYRKDKLQFLLVAPAAKVQDQVKKYAPAMKVVSIKDPGFTVPAF